jgi:hypothetical protein
LVQQLNLIQSTLDSIGHFRDGWKYPSKLSATRIATNKPRPRRNESQVNDVVHDQHYKIIRTK